MLEKDRDFAGDANVSKAIRTVAGNFEVDSDIRAGEAGRYVVIFFEVEPGESEAVSEFGDGVWQADVVGEPVAAGDHGRWGGMVVSGWFSVFGFWFLVFGFRFSVGSWQLAVGSGG
ncbi:MAG: hypothetical protein RLZZ458_347 [Planctomycetota bacterium]